MKGPMQELGDEHRGITMMLRIMRQVAKRIEKRESVSQTHLNKIVEFIKNFADTCHHGKEEGLLFPILLKEPAHETMVHELLGEHKSGRDYIRGITDSLAVYQLSRPDALHIAINSMGYIQLLTEHIQKENKLFAALEKTLAAPIQAELAVRFEAFEHEVIGEGVHEKYHRWIEELSEAYLV